MATCTFSWRTCYVTETPSSCVLRFTQAEQRNRFPARAEVFISVLRCPDSRFQRVTRALSPAVERRGRDRVYSPPSPADVKRCCSRTLIACKRTVLHELQAPLSPLPCMAGSSHIAVETAVNKVVLNTHPVESFLSKKLSCRQLLVGFWTT